VSRLPAISGLAAVKALGRIGYQIDHQTGSHLILRQTAAPHRRLTVPNHKQLAKGKEEATYVLLPAPIDTTGSIRALERS